MPFFFFCLVLWVKKKMEVCRYAMAFIFEWYLDLDGS